MEDAEYVRMMRDDPCLTTTEQALQQEVERALHRAGKPHTELPRVTISSERGVATVCINGEPVPGLKRFTVEQSARGGPPVVVLELYAGSLAVHLPHAVLATLDVTDEHELRRHTAARPTLDGPALAAAFAAVEQLQMQHPDTLALRFFALPRTTRLNIAADLALITPERRAFAELSEHEADLIDHDVFTKAKQRGKLREFAQAVEVAYQEAPYAGAGPDEWTGAETVPTHAEGGE